MKKDKFEWNMAESDWKFMEEVHNNLHPNDADDFFGNLTLNDKYVADFQHTLDDSDESSWYLYTNIFEYGKDTGYGRTKDGIPYDLIDDDFVVPYGCRSFELFKRECEKRFSRCIKERERKMLHEETL